MPGAHATDSAFEGLFNALSVDLEEYFQAEAFAGLVTRDRWAEMPSRIEQNIECILELLESRATRATFFVLGWVAERRPELVRTILGCGHEIACHGYDHRLLYSTGPDTFRQDIRRAKALIEDIVGVQVAGYRAPTFSITADTPWALDIIAEEGFLYDSSIFPIRHDRYGIPKANRYPHRVDTACGRPVIEFPLSTVRIMGQNFPIAGGGYLRLLPVRLTIRAVASINRHGHPAIVYFHPWELDPDQPRLGLTGLPKFRHYINIGTMHAKLDRLLDAHQFAPVRDVLAPLLSQ